MQTHADTKTILVVDDDIPTLKSISDELERCGYAVLGAKDGEQGLKLALDEKPDLILLDLIMPKMDGMTMLKKLREENEWGRKVPVIFLTNLPADDKIIRGVTKNEPSYYFVKSDWKIEDVTVKVRELLGK